MAMFIKENGMTIKRMEKGKKFTKMAMLNKEYGKMAL